MRRSLRALGPLVLCTAAVLAACTTVNHLDRYTFEGSRLAAELRTPPEPRLRVDYDVMVDSQSPVLSALSVMSNLAKANQAARARQAMLEALQDVDVPGIVRDQAFSACAQSLGATPAASRRSADYLLVLRFEEWGIEARSPVSAVSLKITMMASLHPVGGDELAWRREVTVDEPADPQMFGVGPILGTMVTATALYNMNAEDLARGFRQLASLAARRIAMLLEEDLDRARFGG